MFYLIYNKVRIKTITSKFIRIAYDVKQDATIWCVVLDCTRQVVFMSASLEQCTDLYPMAIVKG